ncbi:MAG: hypothetical protein ACK4JD_00675 [Thermoflexales bacterium]
MARHPALFGQRTVAGQVIGHHDPRAQLSDQRLKPHAHCRASRSFGSATAAGFRLMATYSGAFLCA